MFFFLLQLIFEPSPLAGNPKSRNPETAIRKAETGIRNPETGIENDNRKIHLYLAMSNKEIK